MFLNPMGIVMIQKKITDNLREIYHFKSHWEAVLDDGTTVYQTDVEGEQSEESDWKLLKRYCEENGKKIVNMFYCFRKLRESIGDNKEGYFFCKSVLASMASDEQTYYYLTGYVENGVVKCKKWQVPGWIFVGEEEKDPEEYKDCVIQ